MHHSPRRDKPLTSVNALRHEPIPFPFSDHPLRLVSRGDFRWTIQQNVFRLTRHFRKEIPMPNRKEPPSHLGKVGKTKWRNLIAEFDFFGAEFDVLELYCADFDTLARIDAELATMGVVVAGSEGQPVVNPLLKERRETVKQIDALAMSLALPVEGEEYGRRRSGAARAAAKTRKPPKTNVNRVAHLRGDAV
jgi:P27 family predicted phage terminase small subunit